MRRCGSGKRVEGGERYGRDGQGIVGGNGAEAFTDQGRCRRGIEYGHWTSWVIGVIYPRSQIVGLLLLQFVIVVVGITAGELQIVEVWFALNLHIQPIRNFSEVTVGYRATGNVSNALVL